MAFIRIERPGGSYQGKEQIDAICETLEDLTGTETNGSISYNGSRIVPAAGSMVYCVADDKTHVLMADGSFSGMPESQEENSGGGGSE